MMKQCLAMRSLVSRTVVFLLLAGLTSGCRRSVSPISLEVGTEVVDTVQADSSSAEPSEIREMEASMNLDRDFDDFMYIFVRSPRLQRERVHYPLPVQSADSVGGDSLLRYLDFTRELGFLMGDFYTLLFSHVSQREQAKSQEENAVAVERINLYDMHIRSFCFERRHGKWMLVGLEEKAASETDYADFLDFYAQFSSDSLFQVRHIANRLRYSMLDPEADETYIEGTITAHQWHSFCSDVPSGVISNIRYGQTYSPRHMVLQKCGLANGMQETFTFDLRAGRWQLTSYEN